MSQARPVSETQLKWTQTIYIDMQAAMVLYMYLGMWHMQSTSVLVTNDERWGGVLWYGGYRAA